MDEKTTNSLAAFKAALKKIDKNKLSEIVQKIDNLESSTSNISVVQYFNNIQKDFNSFYCFENIADKKMDTNNFNKIELIENNVTGMIYKQILKSTFTFNIPSSDGSLNYSGSTENETEAYAA